MAKKPIQQADPDDTGQPEPGEGTPQEEAQDAAQAGGKNTGASAMQTIYKLVVGSCLKILFDKNSFQIVAQKMVSSGMPIPRVIGHTAAMVLLSVCRGLQQQGHPVPQPVIIQAGKEVIGDLVQAAIALHIVSPANAKNVANAAMLYGVQDFQNWLHKSGNVSPAMQQQAGLRLSKQGYQMPQQQQGGAMPPQGPMAPPGAPPQGGIVGSAMQPPQQ